MNLISKEYLLNQDRISIETIEQAPVIEERKTGEWKQISPARIYECTVCGQNVMTDDIECYKFCHGCGAKMIKRKYE